MSIVLGKDDLAKYPFLKEAGIYVKGTHFGIDEFARPEFNHILEKAKTRIEYEILTGNVFLELEKYDIDLFTFLISLIMIKCINIESITKKYCLLEAMRVESFLIDDLRHEKDVKKKKLLISKIFDELFDLKIVLDEFTPNLFKMRISDYLVRSTSFHEQEWKLINRSVKGGLVYLDVEEIVRLIRNELSILIYNRIKAMEIGKFPDMINLYAHSIKNKVVLPVNFQTKTLRYPPCINHALDLLNKNENLPHSARFLLATYMLTCGKGSEEVIDLFKNAPDFNERITRYQVEHLSGQRGSLTKYSVPACSKLANENLCFYTHECKGIKNPLQFGRNKLQK
ncbi:MAG TPA: hypothetical protein VK250_09385 [Nitrososphaeraceae archaeon]|nr:hypothetical protein [Nitrososphaeraceae archaeon]